MEHKDKFYMRLAQNIADASRCERNKVGALIEKDHNIIAFGYNGTPRGFDNVCEIDENTTKPEVLHAESNAIAKCAASTHNCAGANLYVTVAPCFDCAKLIIQSKIEAVYFLKPYRKNDGLLLLAKAGIKTIQLDSI